MSTRSSPTVRRKPSRSIALVETYTRAPSSWQTISWLLQPVTWNSGTLTIVASSLPASRSTPMQRTAFSLLARKFACEVIAPFGNPVVPLV